jgi:hypothetical protein
MAGRPRTIRPRKTIPVRLDIADYVVMVRLAKDEHRSTNAQMAHIIAKAADEYRAAERDGLAAVAAVRPVAP